MGRRRLDRRSVTLYLNNEIADALDSLPNKSDFVNMILSQYATMIGDFTRQDRSRLIHEEAEKRVMKAISQIIKDLTKQEVIDLLGKNKEDTQDE